MNSSLEELKRHVPLIAPRHMTEFESAEAYEHYVQNMYALRQKGSKPKPPAIAVGLTLSRTKKGLLSIRLSKAKRPFAYVLRVELDALAKAHNIPLAELWRTFKEKQFIIANTRMECEKINSEIQAIPF